MPVKIPLEEPMVPTAGVLLLQVPPAVMCVNVVVALTHTFSVPVIAGGAVDTVTIAVVIQPEGAI